MPNRVKLEIQSNVYTFPINPIHFENKDFDEHSVEPSINSDSIRTTPFSDSRERVFVWRNIPNKSPYWTLPSTLRQAIGISGVRINEQDLRIVGFQDVWRPIIINNVTKTFVNGQGSSKSLNYLSYDLEMRFVYI